MHAEERTQNREMIKIKKKIHRTKQDNLLTVSFLLIQCLYTLISVRLTLLYAACTKTVVHIKYLLSSVHQEMVYWPAASKHKVSHKSGPTNIMAVAES